MLVLAIDTTSEHGGVALCRDHDCLANIPNTGTSAFSITLFQMVDRALEEAGIKLSGQSLNLRDVELFAAANGPGSFTGIRTGLAAVQGWATALERPVVGVSILEAMVHEALPETERALAILDARREEFYVGLFKRDPSNDPHAFQADGEGMVMAPEPMGKILEEQLHSGATLTCIIRENDAPAHILRQNLPGALTWKAVPELLLGSIVGLALEAYQNGKAQAPAQLDALYIRRSDAELNWRS
jgi:tRNA threonylcarbamoyladenosine biosynthesis protein TsaB